jgi:hypothetical protein
MKITKEVIKEFESDQKKHGTALAISNLICDIVWELSHDIGVTGIKLRYKK